MQYFLYDKETTEEEDMMQDHKANLLQNIEKIQEDGVLDGDACSLYADIFELQSATNRLWEEIDNFPVIGTDDVAPVEISSLKFEGTAVDLLGQSFRGICSVVQRHNEGIDTFAAIKMSEAGISFFSSVVDSVLNKNADTLNSMAESARMGYEEFLFIIINWLKPVFVALRERCHENSLEEYRGRTCPFCGYYPDSGMYSTDKEGKRYLRCGLCENLWLYRRMSCAVCGESDARNLDYFVLEGNDRYRIDSCLTCKGYIKSVKLNKFEDIESCDLTVENLLTMSLDAEMLRKGYNRP